MFLNLLCVSIPPDYLTLLLVSLFIIINRFFSSSYYVWPVSFNSFSQIGLLLVSCLFHTLNKSCSILLLPLRPYWASWLIDLYLMLIMLYATFLLTKRLEYSQASKLLWNVVNTCYIVLSWYLWWSAVLIQFLPSC